MSHYVYRLLDRVGEPIYIGASNDPHLRFAAHSRKAWYAEVENWDIQGPLTRDAALALEDWLILTEQPRANIRQKGQRRPADVAEWCAAILRRDLRQAGYSHRDAAVASGIALNTLLRRLNWDTSLKVTEFARLAELAGRTILSVVVEAEAVAAA